MRPEGRWGPRITAAAIWLSAPACVGINPNYETGGTSEDIETADGVDPMTTGSDASTSSTGHDDAAPTSSGASGGSTSETAGALGCPDRPGGLCLSPTVFPIAAAEPSDIAIDDVDADGHLDLVVCDEKNDIAQLLLGDGAGLLQAGAPVPTGERPIAIALGDLDGDGRLDVVTGDRDGNGISVLLFAENAEGQLEPAGEHHLDTRVSDVVLLHADDDAHLDAVVALRDEGALALLLGNGDATFAEPQELVLPDRPEVLAAGNLNDDPLADVAVALSARDIVMSHGPVNAGLDTTVLVETQRGQHALVIADADQDGAADIVSTQPDDDRVSIAWNDGAAPASVPDVYPMSVHPHAVAVGDISQDGHADVVATTGDAFSLLVMLGDSGRSFVNILLPLEQPANDVALADLDNDGDLDVILAGDGRITVIESYDP